MVFKFKLIKNVVFALLLLQTAFSATAYGTCPAAPDTRSSECAEKKCNHGERYDPEKKECKLEKKCNHGERYDPEKKECRLEIKPFNRIVATCRTGRTSVLGESADCHSSSVCRHPDNGYRIDISSVTDGERAKERCDGEYCRCDIITDETKVCVIASIRSHAGMDHINDSGAVDCIVNGRQELK